MTFNVNYNNHHNKWHHHVWYMWLRVSDVSSVVQDLFDNHLNAWDMGGRERATDRPCRVARVAPMLLDKCDKCYVHADTRLGSAPMSQRADSMPTASTRHLVISTFELIDLSFHATRRRNAAQWLFGEIDHHIQTCFDVTRNRDSWRRHEGGCDKSNGWRSAISAVVWSWCIYDRHQCSQASCVFLQVWMFQFQLKLCAFAGAKRQRTIINITFRDLMLAIYPILTSKTFACIFILYIVIFTFERLSSANFYLT